MADLSTLMQMSPYATGVMAGQTHGHEINTSKLRQAELAQLIGARTDEADMARQKMPFELEKLRLANQTTSAQLPGVEADSALKGVNARKAQETYQTGVDATNADNSGKILDNVYKRFATLGHELSGVSDLERPAMFVNSLRQAGIPDQYIERFKSIPPDKLPEAIQKMNELLITNSADYRKSMDVQKSQNESAERRSAGNNAAAIEAARIGANARMAGKKQDAVDLDSRVKQLVQAAKGDAVKSHSIYLQAEALARQEGNAAAALQYAELAAAVRPQAEAQIRAQAKPGEVDVGAVTGLPTNPSPSIRPGGAAPAPVAEKQQQHSLSEVQKMYPGVPPEKIREAYKKKFGVDLK